MWHGIISQRPQRILLLYWMRNPLKTFKNSINKNLTNHVCQNFLGSMASSSSMLLFEIPSQESSRNVVVVSPASPSFGHAGHVAWSVVAGLVFESPELPGHHVDVRVSRFCELPLSFRQRWEKKDISRNPEVDLKVRQVRALQIFSLNLCNAKRFNMRHRGG